MGIAKKIVMVIAVMMGLLLAAVAVLMAVVDPNDYKADIQQKAAEYGVELTMAGDMRWTFFPRLGFAVSQLDALVPMGATKQPLHVGEFTVALSIAPLFTGNVAFSALALKDGALQLANDARAPLVINNIDVLVKHLNTHGDAFPVSVSLNVAQESMRMAVALDAQASVDLAGGRFGVQQMTLQLSSENAGEQQDSPLLKVQGNVAWQQGEPRQLTVDIKGDRLDVDRLLAAFSPAPAPTVASSSVPSAAPTTTSTTTSAAGKNKKSGATTSAEPLPLAGVFAVPGDFRVALNTVIANHMTFSQVLLSATVQDNVMTLHELSAVAYQGEIHNSGSITYTNPEKPQLKIDTTVKGVQLSPLLTDLQQAPSKVLAGSLTLDAQSRALLRSQSQLLKSISASANVSVPGLVIDEMNIEQRTCEAAAQFSSKSLSNKQWSPKTELREMDAHIQIANGVMLLSPLSARLDNLSLTGTGVVNLLDSTVDLPLDLVLIGNQQAANFCPAMNERLMGLKWPLRCKGNYVTESGGQLCGIDKSRLDKLILQAATKELEGKIGDKVKGALQGLFD